MSNDAPVEQRIERAFRDVLTKAIAWRIITDQPGDPDLAHHATRELRAAVVEYEAAVTDWDDPTQSADGQHQADPGG